MTSLLISLLVALVIAALVYYVITLLPLPPPVKLVAQVGLAIILLVWLLSQLGVLR